MTTKALLSVRPAHIGDGRDLDGAVADQLPQPLAADALGERVVERAQIGRELLLQIAGQKAQALARLDRRAGQDDAAHAPGLERLDRGGDGEIGLAGAGRPERQRQVVLLDRRHERALVVALRPDLAQIALLPPRLALISRRIPGHTPNRCSTLVSCGRA